MKKVLLIFGVILALVSYFIFVYNYKFNANLGALENQKDKDSSEIIDNNKTGIISASAYDQIIDYISGDENYMLVIGKKNCTFCDMYKPVLEEVVMQYKFSYMYVDIKMLSDGDARLFFDSDIIIPGKCHSSSNDSHLADGFGTPLTLFIKKKTSYDCIRGYVDKDTLVSKLKEISFID